MGSFHTLSTTRYLNKINLLHGKDKKNAIHALDENNNILDLSVHRDVEFFILLNGYQFIV
jgi:hypothetical protein